MMHLPGFTHAPLRTAARTPTLATRRGGLVAKDTQRAAALRGWLRLRLAITLCLLHTHRQLERGKT